MKTIERTGAAAQRAQRWLDEYMDAFAAAGYPPDGCAIVRAHLDSLPWVHTLEDAHARIISWHLSGDPDPGQAATDRYMAGWRTWRSATDDERLRHIADYFGVRVEEAAKWSDMFHASPGVASTALERPCALYRHFDSDGVLLYAGISVSPDERHKQHARRSKWFKYVAETTVEWHDTTAEAHDIERQVIDLEAPLFNKTHNTKRQARALDYLLERVA